MLGGTNLKQSCMGLYQPRHPRSVSSFSVVQAIYSSRPTTTIL